MRERDRAGIKPGSVELSMYCAFYQVKSRGALKLWVIQYWSGHFTSLKGVQSFPPKSVQYYFDNLLVPLWSAFKRMKRNAAVFSFGNPY